MERGWPLCLRFPPLRMCRSGSSGWTSPPAAATLIREVAPADRTGVLRGMGAALTDDTKSYAYGYQRMTSQLFVVEGAR